MTSGHAGSVGLGISHSDSGTRRSLARRSSTYLAEPPDRLADYEGAYYSEELGTTYRLAVKDSRLVVQHRRYEDIPLTPSGPDAFSSDTWFFRTLTFTRAGGRVTELRVTNNRARNLRFVKL